MITKLIEDRKNESDVQRSRARVLIPDEAKWLRTIAEINRLSPDFMAVLKKHLGTRPDFVRNIKTDKVGIAVVELPKIEGNDCYLEIVESRSDGVTKAMYTAYQRYGKKAYVRSLIQTQQQLTA